MPWTPIRTMRRGRRPDFTLLHQPEKPQVTGAQRWFLDQLLDLEPGTEDQDSGGYVHKSGYHDTVAHNDARSGVGNDYSNTDPQDRRGPRDKTRARDWTFTDAQEGHFADFAKYGDRVLAAYRRQDPRVTGWREYLGRVSEQVTVDGTLTRRVGTDFRHRFLRIPDDRHDWHAHFSESTEQVESFWNKWAMLTILAGWTEQEWRDSVKEDDEDMRLILARDKGDPQGKVYVGNGVSRRHVGTRTDLENLQFWLKKHRGYSDEEIKVHDFAPDTLVGVLGVLVQEPDPQS